MKKIAFVDDDKSVLDGLRRMLRSKRKEWDMSFYLSGEELLGEVPCEHFDIVVSDMRMPQMNGGELLSRMREVSPSTLRLVLSGYANEEMILESIHATHQFISKPADSDKIIGSLNRAIRLQDSLTDSRLKELVGSIGSLPALPAIYDELMGEICDEDTTMDRIGKIVSRDSGLTASLLKVVNSAFFGLVRHVESPEQAASILGMDAIKNLALSTSVFSSFQSDVGNLRAIESLNDFSQRVGVLAGMTAKASRLDSRAMDHAQIAGMMSGLGDMIVLTYLDGDEADKSSLLGSYLLGIWAMPFAVVEAVRWCRNPAESEVDVLSPLAVVHFAWAVLTGVEAGEELSLEMESLDREYLSKVVNEQELNNWLRAAQDFCEQITIDDE